MGKETPLFDEVPDCSVYRCDDPVAVEATDGRCEYHSSDVQEDFESCSALFPSLYIHP